MENAVPHCALSGANVLSSTHDEPSDVFVTSTSPPWNISAGDNASVNKDANTSHRASSIDSNLDSEHSDELLSASLRGDVSSTGMMADVSTSDVTGPREEVDHVLEMFEITRDHSDTRAHTLPADLSVECRIFNPDDIPKSSKWANFKKMFYLGAAHNMHTVKGGKLSTKASKYSQCQPTTTESGTQTARGDNMADFEGLDLEDVPTTTRNTRKLISWNRFKVGLGLKKIPADGDADANPGEEGEKGKVSTWMDSMAHNLFPRLNQEAASSARQWSSSDTIRSGNRKFFSATLPRDGQSSCNMSGPDNKGFVPTSVTSDNV